MKKLKKKQIGLLIALVFVGFLTIFPFYLLVVNSFKHSLQLAESIWFFDFPMHFSNYQLAMKDVWMGVLNSILYTTCIVTITLVISTLAAFSFATFEFPGKEYLFYGIIIFMMIPGFATLIPRFMLVKDLGLLNTRLGVILPISTTLLVLPVMFFRNAFEELPKELFEAARVEGISDLGLYCKIVIPLSKAMIGTMAINNGLNAWNNYIWPLVTVSDKSKMPAIQALAQISNNAKEGMGPSLAAYVIVSIPMIFLFSIATKPFIQGMTAGAVKG